MECGFLLDDEADCIGFFFSEDQGITAVFTGGFES